MCTYHSRGPLRLNLVNAPTLPHTRGKHIGIAKNDHAYEEVQGEDVWKAVDREAHQAAVVSRRLGIAAQEQVLCCVMMRRRKR